MYENQRPRKAKTTFETFSTTSNVVSLMSYVSIRACGTVFQMCGNSVPAEANYSSCMHSGERGKRSVRPGYIERAPEGRKKRIAAGGEDLP